jgi:hypothetical protein
MDAFEEQTMMDLYKGRLADEGMGITKFNKVVAKVKAEKMTLGQAAATLSTTY